MCATLPIGDWLALELAAIERAAYAAVRQRNQAQQVGELFKDLPVAETGTTWKLAA